MKRLGCILVLLALSCSPLLAERVVKVEALSTDTTTFRQNKIQLNMTELAAQLAPFQPVVDLSLYVLLAGDADGQTVQGRTVATSPRLELASSDSTAGTLISGSAAGPYAKFEFDSFNDDEVPSFTIKALSGSYSTGLACLPGSCTASANNGAGGTGSMVINTGEAYLAGSTFSRLGNGSGDLILLSPAAPASASDPCTEGETVFDASYIYRCISADTWKRTALSTW